MNALEEEIYIEYASEGAEVFLDEPVFSEYETGSVEDSTEIEYAEERIGDEQTFDNDYITYDTAAVGADYEGEQTGSENQTSDEGSSGCTCGDYTSQIQSIQNAIDELATVADLDNLSQKIETLTNETRALNQNLIIANNNNVLGQQIMGASLCFITGMVGAFCVFNRLY